MVGWLRGCTQIGRLCGTQPGALRASTRPGLGGLAYPRVQGLDDVGKKRIAELEKEVRELRRANEILKAASAYFARELDPRLPR